jgi:hypothetical protein
MRPTSANTTPPTRGKAALVGRWLRRGVVARSALRRLAWRRRRLEDGGEDGQAGGLRAGQHAGAGAGPPSGRAQGSRRGAAVQRQAGRHHPKRPGLEACLEALVEGDTLLVWKLDRLGRSVVDLVEIVASLKARGVGFRCLRDSAIDTTTPAGELVFHIFAALAQFEREMIRERTWQASPPPEPGASSPAATPSPRSRPRSKPPAGCSTPTPHLPDHPGPGHLQVHPLPLPPPHRT